MDRARLAQLMEAAGVTQTELARETGVSVSAVNHYLSGFRNIPADFAVKAEQYLALKASERIEKIRAAKPDYALH